MSREGPSPGKSILSILKSGCVWDQVHVCSCVSLCAHRCVHTGVCRAGRAPAARASRWPRAGQGRREGSTGTSTGSTKGSTGGSTGGSNGDGSEGSTGGRTGDSTGGNLTGARSGAAPEQYQWQ